MTQIISTNRYRRIPDGSLTSKSEEFSRTQGRDYFVKISNGTDESRKFLAESESLIALRRSIEDQHDRFVPKLYKNSTIGTRNVMVTDYFNKSNRCFSKKSETELAVKLSSLHDPKNPKNASPNGSYGFNVPTFCGETEQVNKWEKDWMVFFREFRIKELIRRIDDPEINSLAQPIYNQVIPFLLSDFEPRPSPVIIHGDLWSGNVSLDEETGQVFIYDPSSYYGHNEVELGIMMMFGGRSEIFFNEYHKRLPKSQPHHEQRIKLYELYHHLNHTLIFGGGYKSGSTRIMNQLINFVQKHT
ncbi:Fructosamine/Ketosamine-3-kinase [Phakopsora pachyrhizi]|nr:Fructosamine/Ketosamine-3-kinase [Phakopsora pachyrhizi]